MIKKIHILLISIFVFLLSPTISFAQTANISKITTLPADETINRDYFAGSERVIISGTVNGDVYVAGGDVAFDGSTTSDLIVLGGNLTISGLIEGDVRLIGGNVTFSGASVGGNMTVVGGSMIVDQATRISGSVVAVGGNFQFMGPIGKNLTVAGGNVVVGNDIGGDIWSPGVGSLNLMNGAIVNGQLTYTSEEEALVAEGATVSGVIERRAPPVESEEVSQLAEKIAGGVAGIIFLFWLADIIMSILLGLLLMYFVPNFVNKVSEQALGNIGSSFLIGLIIAIICPIVILIFILTIIGIPLSMMLLTVFALYIWIAKVLGSVTLGRRILRAKKSESSYLSLFVGIFGYYVLGIIPLIGGLLQAFIVLTGMGSIAILKKNYYKDLKARKMI